MSKTADDKHDRAAAPVVDEPDATATHTPRQRRVNAIVDDAGLNVIDRAVMLWLAKKALMEPDSPSLYGQALVHFARNYIQGEFAKSGTS